MTEVTLSPGPARLRHHAEDSNASALADSDTDSDISEDYDL